MATLQVREMPDEIYAKLTQVAEREHRSIAQQAVVLLRESMKLDDNLKLNRQALLEQIKTGNKPVKKLDPVRMVREDRDR